MFKISARSQTCPYYCHFFYYSVAAAISIVSYIGTALNVVFSSLSLLFESFHRLYTFHRYT